MISPGTIAVITTNRWDHHIKGLYGKQNFQDFFTKEIKARIELSELKGMLIEVMRVELHYLACRLLANGCYVGLSHTDIQPIQQ